MWSLGSTLFMLLFAGVPIGISLAGATAIGVLFDDFLTYSTLFEAFFSFLTLSLIHISEPTRLRRMW